ncbi:uncharacterized protein DEA37_0004411 [Paragonimus westermani]|uniref:GIY-YIG domain-containing protein n=1 Tax=Paragonimus westermani TaxID=34504 RepID=A0A5J4NWB5_9TREM|nr:uncharacterized protein DEA37_0004411 [Paragonimus westermani]
MYRYRFDYGTIEKSVKSHGLKRRVYALNDGSTSTDCFLQADANGANFDVDRRHGVLRLGEELDLITSVLQSNGYPRIFIDRHSRQKLPSEKVVTVEKKRVYIELHFRGDFVMHQTAQRLRNSVKRTFNAAELRVLAWTQKLPLPSVKGDQLIGATSHCAYQFVCNCGESYIGRTESCLSSRVKEHLPKWVQKSVLPEAGNVAETRKQPVSSFARHVLATGHAIDPSFAFRTLLRHSNPRFLRFAEAVAIDRLKPSLCVQKQLFVNLTLP